VRIAAPPPGRVAIALLLGFATTLAAAWASAAWTPWRNPRIRSAYLEPEGASRAGVHVQEARQAGAAARIVVIFDEVEGRWPEIETRLPDSADLALGERGDFSGWGRLPGVLRAREKPGAFREEARGWPFLAFWCWRTDPDSADPVRYHGGLNLSNPNDYETFGRVLPYQPVWRGLAGNTAAFAGAWLLLLSVPGLVRRAARPARRGNCTACGYQLTPELECCPECGRLNPRHHR
jgi:hypothetical protein